MESPDRLKLTKTAAKCSCGWTVGRVVSGTTQVLCLDCKSLVVLKEKK